VTFQIGTDEIPVTPCAELSVITRPRSWRVNEPR